MLSYFRSRSSTEKLQPLLDNIVNIDALLKALFDVNSQREFGKLIDDNDRLIRGLALHSWLEHGGKQYLLIIREFGITLRIELENFNQVINFKNLIDRIVMHDRKRYRNDLVNFFKKYPSVVAIFEAYMSDLLPVSNAFLANFSKEHKKLIDERPLKIGKNKPKIIAPLPKLPEKFEPASVPLRSEEMKTVNTDVKTEAINSQKDECNVMADFLINLRATLWNPDGFIITTQLLGFFSVRRPTKDTATLALAKKIIEKGYFTWGKSAEELREKIAELQVIFNDSYNIDGFIPEKSIRDFYHEMSQRCDIFTKLNSSSVESNPC